MNQPLRISWRHLQPSPTVEALVRRKAAHLERFHDRITACAVTLELPQRHQRLGKHFRVRIEISVPGETLVVGRDPAASKVHEDLAAAVNAVFREARRALEAHAGRLEARVRPARSARSRIPSSIRRTRTNEPTSESASQTSPPGPRRQRSRVRKTSRVPPPSEG